MKNNILKGLLLTALLSNTMNINGMLNKVKKWSETAKSALGRCLKRNKKKNEQQKDNDKKPLTPKEQEKENFENMLDMLGQCSLGIYENKLKKYIDCPKYNPLNNEFKVIGISDDKENTQSIENIFNILINHIIKQKKDDISLLDKTSLIQISKEITKERLNLIEEKKLMEGFVTMFGDSNTHQITQFAKMSLILAKKLKKKSTSREAYILAQRNKKLKIN